MPKSVASGDRERFVEMVRAEFAVLHAGNAVRFGLGPLEFETWQRRGH
jgi:hypothetical protein